MKNHKLYGLPATFLLGVSAGLFVICPVHAQTSQSAPPVERKEAPPADLLEVGVTEKLGEQIPLDLTFENTRGEKVQLRDFFDDKHPVILTLNYSNCPMLCNLQLEGLFDALKEMEWELGNQFQMVSVSIDPTETVTRALRTKQKYLKQYGRSSASDGLHFLVGKQADIRALADAVGFRYKYLREKDEYAHVAAAMILTPDGTVSRYLYDVEFKPQTLKLALLEATEGKIGSTMDQVLLFCYQYDATSGTYAPAAFRLMQIGAIAIVLFLGGGLLIYWIRESARRRLTKTDKPAAQSPA